MARSLIAQLADLERASGVFESEPIYVFDDGTAESARHRQEAIRRHPGRPVIVVRWLKGGESSLRWRK
jgi:hypothetical protein